MSMTENTPLEADDKSIPLKAYDKEYAAWSMQ